MSTFCHLVQCNVKATFQVRLKVLNYMVTFIKKATNYAHKNAIRIQWVEDEVTLLFLA